jgi:hypothetical protein
MNVGHMIGRGILGAIVLGCICISAVFAFEFGSAKGETPVHQWAFGLAGGGLDLLKAALPIIAAGAAAARQRAKGRLAWLAFTVLTIMSLWCAWGTTAGQLAERIGNKAVEASKQDGAKGKLERLKAERDGMRFDRADDATVKAAEGAVAAAQAAVEQECGTVGRNCRKRQEEAREARATHTKALADRVATARHRELTAQIEAAEAILDTVDTKKLTVDADPQAASIAKATGWNADAIAAFSHLLFAVGIEIGSGLGLWLVFGHGEPKHREPDIVEAQAPAPAPAVTLPADAPLLPDSSLELRARFFRECVKVEKGEEIAGKRMYRAYAAFAESRGEQPMSATAFGMDSPMGALKHKTNRGVVYRNCAFVPGAVVELPEPERAPVLEMGKPQLRLVSHNLAPA